MYKKLISSLLVIAVLNFVGCYSTEIVSPNQYKEYEFSGGAPSDILVKMNNLKEYRFAKGKYSIKQILSMVMGSKWSIIFIKRTNSRRGIKQ